MKRKTTLSLMELAIMVAVFALAAAICLRAFVWADVNSRRSEAESWAAALCQSTAEHLKAADGNAEARLRATAKELDIRYGAFAGESDYAFEARYNADFTVCTGREYSYRLVAAPVKTSVPGLGKAEISVLDAAHGDTLFSIEAAWQEVTGNE